MLNKLHITESESKDMVLDSYVTYIHAHTCSSCGCVESFSQVFEVWLHPTKTRTTNLRDLRPVVGLALKPLNMAIIKVPPKMIPICCACAGSYKVVGRPEMVTVHANMDSWQETLRRKYAPPSAEPKIAKTAAHSSSTKTVPRLDQI